MAMIHISVVPGQCALLARNLDVIDELPPRTQALVAKRFASPRIQAAWAADPNVHAIIRLWHLLEAVTLDRPTGTAASPSVVAHLPLPTHLHTGVSIPVNGPVVLRGCKLVVVGIGAGNVSPFNDGAV